MKFKHLMTLIWYNIKSKKRSAIYLFLGFFFMILLIQAFLVYTSILDNKYKQFVKNDENNYIVFNKDIYYDEYDYFVALDQTEFVVTTIDLEIQDFNYLQSTLTIEASVHPYQPLSDLPLMPTYHYEFKQYYDDLIPFYLKDYHPELLAAGRYPVRQNEILISANFLSHYGITVDDILNKRMILSDGSETLVHNYFVSGILKEQFSTDENLTPTLMFRVVKLYNQNLIQDIHDRFQTETTYYSRIYFSTYEHILDTVYEIKTYFGSQFISYIGQDNADTVLLLVRQSIFAKEMFKLIGSILIISMFMSLMVSILFRIKNQATYISICHVYGMKKRSLLLSIYIELLMLYLSAAFLSTISSIAIFSIVNRFFQPAFSIRLIPSFMDLLSSFMFIIYIGILIVSLYSTVVIMVVKQYKPISILRMSHR